jgi:1,4-dihydroxy-2-naphthoyl-CoA hydrolase
MVKIAYAILSHHDHLNARGQGYLPGLIGIEFLSLEPGRLTSRLAVRPELLAPNGYLHAAAIIALADTTCGYGTFTDLPEGANNFTTIELKSNFLGTAREGSIACVATIVHNGRTTQVWDATVTDAPRGCSPALHRTHDFPSKSGASVAKASGKTMALFRCTQFILYPRPT